MRVRLTGNEGWIHFIHVSRHTLNELCTRVSSKSMTIHFLCMSWCLTGGRSGRGACSAMTRSGGEARPSTLLAPFPGGPFPRPPRQQHSNDRRNPPPPDFLLPRGVDDTGVPSPSLCWPPGDDPKITPRIRYPEAITWRGTGVRKDKVSRLFQVCLLRPPVLIVYFYSRVRNSRTIM